MFLTNSSPIRSLILALTTRCPLACPYCSQGDFRLKADMGPDILRQALLLAADSAAPLTLQLTGGEPALVPELVEQALLGAAALRRPVTVALQSSGVCLDAAMLRRWREHGVQVGLSLDGPPELQERIRGQAAATLRGMMLMERLGQPFRVTTVLTQANVAALDRLVLFLATFRQARGIGLDLLVRRGKAVQQTGDVADPRRCLPDAAALQDGLARMLAALQLVNRQRAEPLRFRELDLVRRCLHGPQRPQPRAFCLAASGESLAVAPDGSLFPCTQVLGDPRFAAGTVKAPGPLPAFPAKPLDADRDCTACPLYKRCPGDCPSRLTENREAGQLACVLSQSLARAGQA